MQGTQDYASIRISTGGLLYRLLTKLRLQDPEGYGTRRRIIVFVALAWLPLFVLAMFEGRLLSGLDMPFVYDVKPYVRYFFVLPLLIVADVLIDPLIASNIKSIGSSGIIDDEGQGRYNKAVDCLVRRKDSHIADVVILAMVFLAVFSYMSNLEDLDISSDFSNWLIVHEEAGPGLSYAGWWFLVVSSPLLKMLLFRWLWRFYVWAEFLFRVSRIKLTLQPTHPDLAGGLGILRNGEGAFVVVFFALAAMLSAALAEEILYTDFTLAQARPIIFAYIVSALIIMALPLVFFTRQLVLAKRWGRVVYGGLGYKLSRAFHEKWGDPADPTTGSELINTADASAVCDYADIYGAVKGMRYLSTGLRDNMLLALVLLVPFLPLAFTEIEAAEVFSRLLGVFL